MKVHKGRIAAIALAALAMAPMPGMAQTGFGFGFHFGDEITDFYPRRITCLTQYQIRQSIARRGFSNIYLNVPNDNRIQVRATRNGWVHLIDFDFCADRILGAQRLRPAG
jgi:hypothetical protein